jgi:hypothetical protein
MNTSATMRNLSLTIIGFKRTENIQQIIRIAKDCGIAKISLSLDKPNSLDALALNAQQKLLGQLQGDNECFFDFQFQKTNVGCAVNVISGIEHGFRTNEYCVILEDDCIPSPDFFRFCLDTIPILEKREDVWLTCGSQFATDVDRKGNAVLSAYPLTWGWFTTRSKWYEMKKLFAGELRGSWPNVSYVEQAYWNAGRRRALEGYTDVWDTVLAAGMRQQGKLAVLPAGCLVTNTGNDLYATHTFDESEWLNLDLGSYTSPIQFAKDFEFDSFIQKRVFGISLRHLLSTRYTQILDFIFRRRRKFPLGLKERLSRI